MARQAPGKQVNRGDEMATLVARAGKAILVGFLAVPVLLTLLISSANLGAEAQAELTAQVLASVLVALITGTLTCTGARRLRC